MSNNTPFSDRERPDVFWHHVFMRLILIRWTNPVDEEHAYRAARGMYHRIDARVGDDWDLSGDPNRDELIAWFYMNAYAGMYCSPSWTRNFSEAFAAVLLMRLEDLKEIDAFKTQKKARDEGLWEREKQENDFLRVLWESRKRT